MNRAQSVIMIRCHVYVCLSYVDNCKQPSIHEKLFLVFFLFLFLDTQILVPIV